MRIATSGRAAREGRALLAAAAATLAPGEGLADRVRCGGHRDRERGPRVLERAELAERDAAEIAEERPFVVAEEDVAILRIP